MKANPGVYCGWLLVLTVLSVLTALTGCAQTDQGSVPSWLQQPGKGAVGHANREVWNGQKKIQKLQEQKRFSL